MQYATSLVILVSSIELSLLLKDDFEVYLRCSVFAFFECVIDAGLFQAYTIALFHVQGLRLRTHLGLDSCLTGTNPLRGTQPHL